MSLAPKIDEISTSLLNHEVDVVCFTETWLSEMVPGNTINILGYNIVRKDRVNGRRGGVCSYINDSIPFEIINYHDTSNRCEVLWMKARPTRLPRGFSSLIIGTIYHPPSADSRNM